MKVVGKPSISSMGVQIVIHTKRSSHIPPPKKALDCYDQEWPRMQQIAKYLMDQYRSAFDGEFEFTCVDQQQRVGNLLEQQFSWRRKTQTSTS